MAIYLKTQEVEPWLANKLQGWIDSGEPIPDCGPWETAHIFTLPLGRYEADIKVCNGDGGAWIDAVLFKDGYEVTCIEPSYELLGEFTFEIDGDEYWAILKLEGRND